MEPCPKQLPSSDEARRLNLNDDGREVDDRIVNDVLESGQYTVSSKT